MTDIEWPMETPTARVQREMTERIEDAILQILTGRLCACGKAASHVEFGPVQTDFDPETLTARMTRPVNYYCGDHWRYGSGVTVAEVQR